MSSLDEWGYSCNKNSKMEACFVCLDVLFYHFNVLAVGFWSHGRDLKSTKLLSNGYTCIRIYYNLLI